MSLTSSIFSSVSVPPLRLVFSFPSSFLRHFVSFFSRRSGFAFPPPFSPHFGFRISDLERRHENESARSFSSLFPPLRTQNDLSCNNCCAGSCVQCRGRASVAERARAGVFQSILPVNAAAFHPWFVALCQAVDIVCYLLIMAGISLDAVYLPTSPKKIDVRPASTSRIRGQPLMHFPDAVSQVVELSRLFREPAGIMFWVVVLSTLMGLQSTHSPAHQACTVILGAHSCWSFRWRSFDMGVPRAPAPGQQ